MRTKPTLLVLLSAAAYAGPRDSNNYSIGTETQDAGGQRTASASYTNDGSAGSIVGVSTVAAPAETAKHGFIGQLYESTGLALTSASPTVDETATVPLAAWLALDDATFLAAPSGVTWSVLSGPLTGISAGGLATAGTVFQNTAATVQGIHLGFTATLGLTVVNTLPDNFGGYAGDGLGDDWQVQYFGQPPNANAGPLLDPDRDGQTNLFEFNAGLVPTDPASWFQISIAPVPGLPAQRRISFSPIVLTAGRNYTVEYSTDPATGSWTALTGTTLTDSGAQRTVTDPAATGARRFYRVEITRPQNAPPGVD